MPDRSDLRAACDRCFGLCCVAPAFEASADFAITKPAGKACPNLQPDFRCGIHQHLRTKGFPGCVVYDCFGAGQKVAQVSFGGRDWRNHPDLTERMFSTFAVMRQLHEMLWYLAEAETLGAESDLSSQINEITKRSPDELAGLDVAALWQPVNVLLTQVSAATRSAVGRRMLNRKGADLVGAKLKRADLRAANLRGAYLIGADLSEADLRFADLIGADLRGANLHGADLRNCIYLTQAQLDSAIGDTKTRLSPSLRQPAHWSL